jgi:hypothetical protein
MTWRVAKDYQRPCRQRQRVFPEGVCPRIDRIRLRMACPPCNRKVLPRIFGASVVHGVRSHVRSREQRRGVRVNAQGRAVWTGGITVGGIPATTVGADSRTARFSSLKRSGEPQ